MIYLFVFLLTTATPSGTPGWSEGAYSVRSYQYQTIGACEAARHRIIDASTRAMLVSRCATGPEAPAFGFYSNGQALPADTPKPPVYDERPLPPSAPVKPNWKEAA